MTKNHPNHAPTFFEDPTLRNERIAMMRQTGRQIMKSETLSDRMQRCPPSCNVGQISQRTAYFAHMPKVHRSDEGDGIEVKQDDERRT